MDYLALLYIYWSLFVTYKSKSTWYFSENEEIIVPVNAIYAIAQNSLKQKIQDFNGVWTCDLAITGAMLYQLSYEARRWE